MDNTPDPSLALLLEHLQDLLALGQVKGKDVYLRVALVLLGRPLEEHHARAA